MRARIPIELRLLCAVLLCGTACNTPNGSMPKAAAQADCLARLAEPLTLSKVRARVDGCGIRTVDDLVSALPSSYLTHYVLLHHSQSLQAASFQYPRLVAYGELASVILAFEGNPAEPDFGTVEEIEFDPTAARYSFQEIAFSNGPAAHTAINPGKCTDCHGENPKPIWGTYPLWFAGLYGAEDDGRTSYYGRMDDTATEISDYTPETTQFDTYLAIKNAGVYRQFVDLPVVATLPATTPTQPNLRYFADGMYNLAFSAALDKNQSAVALREILGDPKLKPFRFALYGMLRQMPPMTDSDFVKADCKGAPLLPTTMKIAFDSANTADAVSQMWVSIQDAARANAALEESELGTAAPMNIRIRNLLANTRPENEAPKYLALKLLIEDLAGGDLATWRLGSKQKSYDFNYGGVDLPYLAADLKAELATEMANPGDCAELSAKSLAAIGK